MTNILQSEVLTQFVYPFLLIFFIVFAVLEKTKIFGDGKKQINAFVAFVIGLIFVGAIFPKLLVNNLILFLSVSIVIVFVILLIWGFITGGDAKFEGKAIKIIAAFVVIIALVIFIFLTTGIWDSVFNTLFQSDWSNSFWTNVVFVVIIAAAMAAVLASAKSK
jgi:hypothetical protein